MTLNNQWVNTAIKDEMKKYIKTAGKENTMVQNIWDSAKAVLRGKFTAMKAYLKKQKKNLK